MARGTTFYNQHDEHMQRRKERVTRGGTPPPRAHLMGGDEPRGVLMPAVGHAGRMILYLRPS